MGRAITVCGGRKTVTTDRSHLRGLLTARTSQFPRRVYASAGNYKYREVSEMVRNYPRGFSSESERLFPLEIL